MAAEPEFEWVPIGGFNGPGGLLLFNKPQRTYLMRVWNDFDGRWRTEPWSGESPKNPPAFDSIEDAKIFAEVTAKLCGS